MGIGLSRPVLLALLGVLAVVGILGGLIINNNNMVLETQAPIPPPPIDPVPDRPPDQRAEQLLLAVEDHFEKFEDRNYKVGTNGLLSDYLDSQETTAEWTGPQAGFYGGTYRGFLSLRILYASVLGNTESINITISNYEATIEGDRATTTMHLLNTGVGKTIGEFEMDVDVTMMWLFQEENAQWLITDETWVFEIFKVELVAEGTVFPLHWLKRGDFSIWDERTSKLLAP